MSERNVAVVYRAKHNAPLEEWDAEYAARTKRYNDACIALEAELGRKLVENAGLRGAFITGYQPQSRNEDPKPGFRFDKKTGYMYPAKRTPEGKEHAKRLNNVSFRVPQKPGLPEIVMGGGYMGPLHVEKLDGQFFATLGFDPIDERHPEIRGVDLNLWEPVKRSAYWAAKEEATA